MKKIIALWCWCCSLHVVCAQTLLWEQHFSNLQLVTQSILRLGGDTLRVGGINAIGELEWMDFKTENVCKTLINEPIRIKLSLDFKPTALQFLNSKQILLAGHRHQDTLEWAILNTELAKIVRQGILPDSVRKGQINTVRRLQHGDMIFGGKRYGDLLLIRADAKGKVTHVLNHFKALKDEIFDVFEAKTGKIYATGYLKDNVFNSNLMYILTIDKALSVSAFKLVGEPDSLNVGYATIASPTQLPVVVGVQGQQAVVLWLDETQEIEQRMVLPSTVGFKNVQLEHVLGHRYRVWATDKTDKLHLFLIDKE
jgi:hypothetical protein